MDLTYILYLYSAAVLLTSPVSIASHHSIASAMPPSPPPLWLKFLEELQVQSDKVVQAVLDWVRKANSSPWFKNLFAPREKVSLPANSSPWFKNLIPPREKVSLLWKRLKDDFPRLPPRLLAVIKGFIDKIMETLWKFVKSISGGKKNPTPPTPPTPPSPPSRGGLPISAFVAFVAFVASIITSWEMEMRQQAVRRDQEIARVRNMMTRRSSRSTAFILLSNEEYERRAIRLALLTDDPEIFWGYFATPVAAAVRARRMALGVD